MLTVVEKVIFLQKVDVFSQVPTEQLAHLAVIAEETPAEEAERIYEIGDPSDALYVVLRGRVRLHRGETDVTVANAEDAFGTWALFDDEPRLTAATALEATALLRVDRDDFVDVLADHVQLTQGVLKAIVRRLRALGRAVGRG